MQIENNETIKFDGNGTVRVKPIVGDKSHDVKFNDVEYLLEIIHNLISIICVRQRRFCTLIDDSNEKPK